MMLGAFLCTKQIVTYQNNGLSLAANVGQEPLPQCFIAAAVMKHCGRSAAAAVKHCGGLFLSNRGCGMVPQNNMLYDTRYMILIMIIISFCSFFRYLK